MGFLIHIEIRKYHHKTLNHKKTTDDFQLPSVAQPNPNDDQNGQESLEGNDELYERLSVCEERKHDEDGPKNVVTESDYQPVPGSLQAII